ncbi:unnamed protein product, partial [marine sediment metagenome]
ERGVKVYILGSTAYAKEIAAYAKTLKKDGHEVELPLFDSIYANELEIITENRARMEWSDEVHVLYDGRSQGSIFDFGMAFALRKPMKIVLMSARSITHAFYQYAKTFQEEVEDK